MQSLSANRPCTRPVEMKTSPSSLDPLGEAGVDPLEHRLVVDAGRAGAGT